MVDDLFANEARFGEKLQFSLCVGINGGYMSVGGYDRIRHEPGATTETVEYDGSGGLYRINIH